MPNDTWDSLGLGGGYGSVNIRGATPPVGNTGPGGAAGMGIMALLRRLSMGLDQQPDPEPMSPDPAAERGMANLLGVPDMQQPMDQQSDEQFDWRKGAMGAAEAASDYRSSPAQVLTAALAGGRVGPTEKDMAATGQPTMDPMMETRGGMSPTAADMAATGNQMQPMPPVPMSKPQMMPGMPMPPPGMEGMTPEQMRMIYEQEMRRLQGTGAGY